MQLLNKKAHFIRIYKKDISLKKDIYKKVDKRKIIEIPSEYYSNVNYSADHKSADLYLKPKHIRKVLDSNCVIAIDSFNEHDSTPTSIFSANLKEGFLPLEIFSFRMLEDSYPEVWLNYSSNIDRIGFPEREDFFLAPLTSDTSTRLFINGYIELSTRNYSKIYKELIYVIDYLGLVELNIQPFKMNDFKVDLSHQTFRDINLRRLFY